MPSFRASLGARASLVLCAALVAASSAPARADVLVLTAGVGEEAPLEASAREAATRALSARGARLAALPDLPGQAPSVADLSRSGAVAWLGAEVEALLEPAALGRRPLVEARVDAAFVEVERWLEIGLGDAAAFRQRTTDLALLAIRVALAGRDASAAQQRALDLLRLVPTPSPSADLHPPEALALLEGARVSLSTDGASLRVEVVGDEGCTLRVNGAPQGPIPFDGRLAPGEYRIRVECRGVTVEHSLMLTPTGARLVLRPRLSRRFEASRARLRYGSQTDLARSAGDDAQAIGELAGADSLVLIVLRGPRSRLLRWQRQAGSWVAAPTRFFDASSLVQELERVLTPPEN